jgi:aminopeptidase-like protein
VLNQSNGKHSLLEIADRFGIPLSLIFDVPQKMVAAELLRGADRA